MSLSAKLIAFVKNTGTGSQPVTGAGFTVKGGILFSAGASALTTFQAADSGGVGIGLISNGAAQCGAEASKDAAVTSVTAQTNASSAFRIVDSSGAVTAEATLTSLDADGFTLNWTTNDGVSRTIYALVFGGTDLTNILAHTWTMTTGTGNKSVTGVGFVPDLVFLVRGIPGVGMPGTDTIAARVSVGAMDALGNQWAFSTFSQGGSSPSGTTRAFFTDCAISNLTGKAAFVSMDADGYTLNVTGGFNTNPIIALAVKGGTWRVGNTTKPTGAAPASQAITGFGTTPKGLLLAGCQIEAGGDAQAETGIGAASGTSARGALARIDRNNVNPTISKRYQDSTKIYVKVNNGTPAVDAAADLTSFDSDGFTLSWNPNDAVATKYGWLAAGDNPPAPSGGNAVFDGYASNRPFARIGR